jgi:glutamine synthetase
MRYAAWTRCNLGCPVKLRRKGSGIGSLVVRTPDNTCNPYFALGLIINACMDGIEQNISAGEPFDEKDEKSKELEKLPATLGEAVAFAENSAFIKKNMPAELIDYVLNKKREMCEEYDSAENKEEYEALKYFNTL